MYKIGPLPIILTLFITSIAIAIVDQSFTYYLDSNFPRFIVNGLLSPADLSLIGFLINPVSTCLVTYPLARKIDITKDYLSASLSLFLGSFIGITIPSLLYQESILYHTLFTPIYSFAILILLQDSFSLAFVEFFAVALSSFRHMKNNNITSS